MRGAAAGSGKASVIKLVFSLAITVFLLILPARGHAATRSPLQPPNCDFEGRSYGVYEWASVPCQG